MFRAPNREAMWKRAVSDFSAFVEIDFVSVRSHRGDGTVSYDVSVTNIARSNKAKNSRSLTVSIAEFAVIFSDCHGRLYSQTAVFHCNDCVYLGRALTDYRGREATGFVVKSNRSM